MKDLGATREKKREDPDRVGGQEDFSEGVTFKLSPEAGGRKSTVGGEKSRAKALSGEPKTETRQWRGD